MNCQGNVNSTLPTQLPDEFSYIVAILGHNHFESPNMFIIILCITSELISTEYQSLVHVASYNIHCFLRFQFPRFYNLCEGQ
jgi:hypothetical protein